jgi:hypothetical protein
MGFSTFSVAAMEERLKELSRVLVAALEDSSPAGLEPLSCTSQIKHEKSDRTLSKPVARMCLE